MKLKKDEDSDIGNESLFEGMIMNHTKWKITKNMELPILEWQEGKINVRMR